ncbi:ATP-dependent DNA ligase [Candidatus Pacearchaeota archaeon]|nr:ATP-dependent DNA ligase [Candidatus Pacearchaeota archaeon]
MLYSELAGFYERLEKTSKRLEKTEILSELLQNLKHEKDKSIIYLVKGRIFPDYDSREMGISSQLAIKSISKAMGISAGEIVKKWKSIGDLGKVAEDITAKKKQATLSGGTRLTTEKVLENLKKLPGMQGKGAVEKKISLIAELLSTASPLEARYIVRTLLGDLRVGAGEGVLRDAIVWACLNKEEKENYVLVQEAYDKATDFALVFEQACRGREALQETELAPGRPVKVMLFLKVKDIKEAFETVGKPLAAEMKYDGFRMLINKDENGQIRIFTRRLDDVTKQFPEVKEYTKRYVKADSFILDGEAVGFNAKTRRYMPFQEISQRIRRKYDIEKMAKELPIEINIFDILYYNGKSLIKEPFKSRREILEKIVKGKRWQLVLAEQIISGKEEEIEKFYKKALAEGEEGIMLKKLDAPYKPGARVGYGVKLKPEENDFDLVIVKAEYGTGKRAGWLTSYTVACQQDGKLLETGKVSTGLKEKEEEGLSFMEITKKLKPLITGEKGREVSVKPELVVTVTYQNIQKSPTYSSGYALRFPRFTRLRPDRSARDIAFLSEVEKEAKRQVRK